MSDFAVGQQVTWLWKPRGGYGYRIPVKAEVMKVGKKRVQIKTQVRAQGCSEWQDVTKWVPVSSLYVKDSR